MNKITNIIKDLLPFGYIKKRNKKQFYNFLKGAQFGQGLYGSLPKEEPLFEKILAVQGFGFSGHTAGIDLLREYRTVLMPSDPQVIDDEGHYVSLPSIEVDFMRLAGGLMELEKYLGEDNIFQNDAATQRLIKLLGTCKFLQMNDECKKLTFAFVDSIIDFQISGLKAPLYNYHLQDGFFNNDSIYFLKHLKVAEYRTLVKDYLTSIFNTFYKEGKKFLIADHLFSDLSVDLETRNGIVPNLKTIVIYRDPRDVYASAVLYNVDWIPHKELNTFVKWWKSILSNFDPQNGDVLFVKFEELVLNYEVTKNIIEKYIGLNPQDQVYRYSCLNPDKSSANVGIWKKMTDREIALSVIKKELSEFCFEQ